MPEETPEEKAERRKTEGGIPGVLKYRVIQGTGKQHDKLVVAFIPQFTEVLDARLNYQEVKETIMVYIPEGSFMPLDKDDEESGV